MQLSDIVTFNHLKKRGVMNIKDIIEEAKKLGEWPDIEALKKQSDPTLIHVLIEIVCEDRMSRAA